MYCAVPPPAGVSVPNDMTRLPCAGGVNEPSLDAGQVVRVCPACAGLSIFVGDPNPPPSWPRITIEVGVSRLLVRSISRLPGFTMMVGPGAHPVAPLAQGSGVSPLLVQT